MNKFAHARFLGSVFRLFSVGLVLAGSLVANAAWVGASTGQQVVAVGSTPQGIGVHPVLRLAVVANEAAGSVSLVHLDSGDVVATIALASSPREVAVDVSGAVAYVLHKGGQVSVIDLATASVTGQWGTGDEAKAVLLSPDGEELIVAAKEPSRLLRVSTATGVVSQTLSLNREPKAIALSADGSRLFVATDIQGIRVFNAASWSELSPIALNDVETLSYWAEGDRLIAATKRETHVVNLATNGIQTIAAGVGLRRLVVNGPGAKAYLADKDANTIVVVDLNARTYHGRFALSEEPSHLAFDTQTGRVLATLPKAGLLLGLDPGAAVLIQNLFLGEKLTDIAVDNKGDRAVVTTEKERAYVVNLADRTNQPVQLPSDVAAVAVDPARGQALLGFNKKFDLRFLDLETRTFLPEVINLGQRPETIAVDDSRGLAVVVVDKKDQLLLVDTKTRTLVKTLAVSGTYKDAAVHRGKGLAYVVNRDKSTGELLIIDLAAQNVAGTIAISKQVEAIVVDEALDLAVVAVEQKDMLEVIDLNTREVVRTYTLNKRPHALALNADTHTVAIAAKDSDQIALLDLSSQTLTPNFALVNKPQRVSVTQRFNQVLVVAAENGEVLFIQLPNRAPVLTEVVPPDVTAPAPAVALLAIGKHFIDGSKVHLNGQPLVTRWKDNQHLEADVPLDVLQAAGVHSVKVVTPAPGGGESQPLSFTVNNPIPVLTAVSPLEAPAGSADLTLNLTGDRFVATSAVRFGAQSLATTFVDDKHLSAVVPAALLAAPATVPVSVFNPVPGGGSSAAVNFVIVPAGPKVNSIDPAAGEPGTTVTIAGSGFEPVLSNNAVVFGGNTVATVLSGSTTQLVVVAPPSAQTGPVTVTTPKGTAAGPTFTVHLEQDFALTASPATLTLIQNAANSFAVQLANTGTKPFTSIVRLAADGLPSGISAKFEPATITAGASTTLTLTAASSVVPQTFTFNVVGTLTYNGNTYTRSAPATVTLQQGGQTGVKGRFVTPAGQGIAGVYVRMDAIETTSDAAGNFLLLGLSAGQVTLRFDATPANSLYPIWPYQVETKTGAITELGNWTINPPPAIENFTAIDNANQTQHITDARYPGVEVTLPAGVTITGWDGVPKTRIAVQRVEADKLPVPAPPVPIREAYQLHFGTPMGGIPTAPIPVSVPNVTGLEPGEKTDIWYFDGSPMGGSGEWKAAGAATVSADGTQVVSDPGAGIPRFCGVCGLFAVRCPPLPSGDPPSPEPCTEGNPIELLSGYEMPNYGGLRCGGLVPREIGMSFHPVDGFQGRSGIEGAVGHGWVLDYDIVLADSSQVPQSKRLILPPNTRINFAQQPDGTYTASGDPRFRGAVLRLASSSPRIWELTFKDGRIWRFGMSDPVGMTASFLIEQVDAVGNTTQIQRRSDRKITAVGDSRRSYQFTYGANNLVEEIRDPANRSVRMTYNASRRIETLTDADGGVTSYTYVGDDELPANSLCPQGTDGLRIKSILYPGKPNPTINDHGTSRRVLRQVSAGGTELQFEYQLTGACVVHESAPTTRCTGPECPTVDSWENFQAGWRIYGGQVVATTTADANGQRTRNFNAAGVSTQTTDGQGSNYQHIRDAQNRVVRRIDPLGRETQYVYDVSSNVTREIRDANGLNQVIDVAYDPIWNKPTVVTRYRGDGSPLVVSRRTYDPGTGNLTSLIDANERTWTYTYSPVGQLTSILDPGQRVTALDYNDAGDLVGVSDPLGNTTRVVPDNVGRTVANIDALGYRTAYSLNARDQHEQVADAAQGVVQLEYDTRGNLTQVTNQNNEVIQTNTYDDADRLATRTDGAGRSESFTYDGAGNLRTRTDRKGQAATFTYDESNRLTQIAYSDGATETRLYDVVGRLQSISGANGTIGFQYDGLDRLAQVTTPQGWVRYEYDLLDRRTRLETPQQVVTYGYDSQGNLTTITQGAEVTTIEYDESNRRSRLNYPNGIVATYGYDEASRLTSLAYQRGGTTFETLTYVYDPNGNVVLRSRTTAASKQESAKDATYDPRTNRLLTLNGESFTYDDNGNLATRTNTCGTTTYVWNTKDQLTEIQGFTTNCQPLTAAFAYDVLGRRTQKTINGETISYLYDGMDVIAEIGANTATYLRTGNIDEAIARYATQGDRYLLGDLLGSTIALADRTSETPTTTYSYSPFGEAEEAGQASDDPTQFTGRENDGTGLYYYRARYFAPDLSRFVSADPIGLAGGWNEYAYVGNNPLRWVDPTGKFVFVLPAIPALWTGIGTAIGTGIAIGLGASAPSSPIQSSSTPLEGPPNTWSPDGKRHYGDDGFPDYDLDAPHHDKPYPHVHDWGRPKDGSRPTHEDRDKEGREYCPVPQK